MNAGEKKLVESRRKGRWDWIRKKKKKNDCETWINQDSSSKTMRWYMRWKRFWCEEQIELNFLSDGNEKRDENFTRNDFWVVKRVVVIFNLTPPSLYILRKIGMGYHQPTWCINLSVLYVTNNGWLHYSSSGWISAPTIKIRYRCGRVTFLFIQLDKSVLIVFPSVEKIKNDVQDKKKRGKLLCPNLSRLVSKIYRYKLPEIIE